MSKRAIVNAASKKGITFEVCEWNHVSPAGAIPGWTIRPTDECVGRLEVAGARWFYQDDFENTAEALAWIQDQPDIRETQP